MSDPVDPAASVDPSLQDATDPAHHHSRIDDVQALLTGALFISLGVLMFNRAGLLTGGTAGLAFLLHYATGIGFGPLFFAINLPFYWLAWRRMGVAFTCKTFVSVLLLSLLTTWLPTVLAFAALPVAYAAVMGGLLVGTGLLILFRHHASLGGVGLVALTLQQTRGWRAGHVQMAVDCAIVGAALFLVEPAQLGWSLLGAVALNLTLAFNHRPGRYVAM